MLIFIVSASYYSIINQIMPFFAGAFSH